MFMIVILILAISLLAAGAVYGAWETYTKYSRKEDAISRLDFVINNKVCSIESIDYDIMTAVVGSYA